MTFEDNENQRKLIAKGKKSTVRERETEIDRNVTWPLQFWERLFIKTKNKKKTHNIVKVTHVFRKNGKLLNLLYKIVMKVIIPKIVIDFNNEQYKNPKYIIKNYPWSSDRPKDNF